MEQGGLGTIKNAGPGHVARRPDRTPPARDNPRFLAGLSVALYKKMAPDAGVALAHDNAPTPTGGAKGHPDLGSRIHVYRHTRAQSCCWTGAVMDVFGFGAGIRYLGSIAMVGKWRKDVGITMPLGLESVPPLYFWNRKTVGSQENKQAVESTRFSVDGKP